MITIAGAAAVQTADLWVLGFTFQKVAVFQPTEGVRRGEVYWYMLYRIENKTGQDREAYITVSARSDKSLRPLRPAPTLEGSMRGARAAVYSATASRTMSAVGRPAARAMCLSRR